MRKGLYSILFILLFANTVFADKFIVESFKPDPNDLSARMENRKDINGDFCAIIKVLSDIEGLKFDANVGITHQIYKQGYYWLYISPGERQLKIMKEGFITLQYTIPLTIESSNVYVMVLTNENKTLNFSDKTAKLNISSNPTGASISIDGIPTPMKTNDEVKAITIGKHKISLKIEDYEPFDTIVSVEKDMLNNININLIPLYSFIKFNISPENAELFISGQKEEYKSGETKKYWKGNKVIEVKAPLYYSYMQEVKTGGGGTKEIDVKLKPNFGSINISTGNVTGAEILINDKQFNKVTPCIIQQIKSGKYVLKVNKKNYDPINDSILVKDEQETKLNYKLIPNVGSVTITSTPESGAQIVIDNNDTYKKTPYTFTDISRGKHVFQIKKDLFTSASKDIEITGGESLEFNLSMDALFGEISITAEPDADILIDNIKAGNKIYNGRLLKGEHSIDITKDKYYPENRSLNIEVGKKENLNYTLKPKTGSLTIETTPTGAEIMIDSKSYGQTPKTISDILIGSYTLKLEKTGCAPKTKTFEIKENEKSTLNETLLTGQEVTILCADEGAVLYIDGQVSGIFPQTLTISFGLHNFSAKKNGCDKLPQKLMISQSTSLITLDAGCNSGAFSDIRDGERYKWIRIGKQRWMSENLNYFTNSGSWCYDDKENNCSKYGRLYDFETAKKVCPCGWHLPRDDEWSRLEMFLGLVKGDVKKDGYIDWSGESNKIGGKLKSLNGWETPNKGATNEIGFAALPCGMRNSQSAFNNIGKVCNFWSYMEISYGIRIVGTEHILSFEKAGIGYDEGDFNNGYSVRCVKDTFEIENKQEVNISSTDEGTELYIDGKASGILPQNVTLSFGEHLLAAKKIGCIEKPQKINITCYISKIKLDAGCGDYLTDSRDSKKYKVVKIGNQTWMAENLNYKTSSGSLCYNNKNSNCETYGRLYNWEAVKSCCPTGWHLPSDGEWKILETELGMSKEDIDKVGEYRGKGTKICEKLIEESSNSHWNIPNEGTNSSGFNALPGGCCNEDKSFSYIGDYAFFWTATTGMNGSSLFIWCRKFNPYFTPTNSSLYRNKESSKSSFSVRCIKDN